MSAPINLDLNGVWKLDDGSVIKVTVFANNNHVTRYMFEENGESIYMNPDDLKSKIKQGKAKKI